MPPSLQEFLATLKSRCGNRDRVGVAVSGGADSVFLLRALHSARLAACAVHVNHRLRGEESDGDEQFVRRLAETLGIPVFVERIPPAEGNLEQEARRARYQFFQRILAAAQCDVIATAHTQDDQAETILARFLRGSGTSGLSGILPHTVEGIVRPILDVPRSVVRIWLRELGADWREDSSNADVTFLRNRIRREVMPALVAINPALPETLAGTAEIARAEEDYWKAELDRLEPSVLRRDGETVLLEVSRLVAFPVALQRRLLRRAFAAVRGSLRAIDFPHVEAVLALATQKDGSGRIQLPGLDIFRSFDWLRIAPLGHDSRLDRDFESPLALAGLTAVPERHLAIEMKLSAGNHVYNSDLHAIDPAKVTGDLLLRNWRPGDALQPLGATGPTKIKSLFQEHRIPLWERRAWPVIALGRSVVWTRRFGVATEFAAGRGDAPVLFVRES